MSPQQVEGLICYLVVVLSIHARHVPQNDEVESERNVALFRLYSALRACDAWNWLGRCVTSSKFFEDIISKGLC